MNDRPEPTLRNDLSGAARKVVQAGQVSGGVHFHGPADADPSPPRQLPADVRGFVNRAADLERLDLLLSEESPDANATAVCLIVGTAGVGKTSLAIHWAHRVTASFPDGQLYVNLRGYDPGPPVTATEALERFLRALGARVAEIPSDVESRAALYRSRLAGRRVLVVLDNAATTSQVRQLLPGVPGCLVLVTSRGRLSGLVARDGAQPLPLKLLSEDDAVGLLSAVTSGQRAGDDLQDLRELAKLCARLPLALRIAAERAISRPWTSMGALIADLRDESGLWDALTAEEDDESDAVRTVFAWSYRALPSDAALDDLPDALTAFQRAAMLHRRLGDRSREARAHDGTGIVYRLMGRPDDAADFHRLAVAVFRDTGEPWPLALALDHLAQAVPAEAEQHWRESADLLAAFPDPHATRLLHEIRTRIGS